MFLGYLKYIRMTSTTAWERNVRRRDVIRLKLGKRMSAPEIAEELGYSPSTIREDFQWLNDHVGKMLDDDFMQEYLMETSMHLMDHEMQDLEDADRENDKKAKTAAKQSMRSTMKMLKEFQEESTGQEAQEVSAEEWLEDLPADIQDGLTEHANDEIEGILES